jgi:hypothetical protein
MRLSIWLSSEPLRPNPASSEGREEEASQGEEAILDFIFHEYVPGAAQKLAGLDKAEYVVDLFAINDTWVRVLKKWTDNGDSIIQVTRANPCMTFVKPEGEEVDAPNGADFASRWQVSSIESEEEITLVRDPLCIHLLLC